MMFRYFENLVDPFPAAPPERPPAELWPFVWHYTRPLAPWIALMALGTAAVSILEVVFLSFLGSLVDLLAGAEREGFFAAHGLTLAGMALLVLVAFPVMQLLGNLVMHQTIFGNYPMLVRWLAHRWMLGQSMSFYQDEFAGRVAQKVMQTALAIRETVMKLTEVFVYVVVYFVGCDGAGRTGRALADGAARPLARGLHRAACPLRAEAPAGLDGAGGRAGRDDRPGRRQLHQHPDGQALRP
jgi:ATP-binding cassette, subfamily B, multidrug efflux pump